MILQVAISQTTSGQTQKVDRIYSLKNDLKNLAGIEEKQKVFYQIGLEYMALNLDSALIYINRAELISGGAPALRGDIYMLKGEILSIREMENSITYFEKARMIFRDTANELHWIQAIGRIYQQKGAGVSPSEMGLLEEAYQRSVVLGATLKQGYLLFVKGVIHELRGDTHKALQHFEASYQKHLEGKHGNPAALISHMGNVQQRLGSFHSALQTYKLAIPFLEANDDTFGFGYLYNHLATAQMQLGLYDLALGSSEISLNNRRITNHRAGEKLTLITMAQIYLLKQDSTSFRRVLGEVEESDIFSAEHELLKIEHEINLGKYGYALEITNALLGNAAMDSALLIAALDMKIELLSTLSFQTAAKEAMTNRLKVAEAYGNKGIVLDAAVALGNWYYLNGDSDAAIEIFRKYSEHVDFRERPLQSVEFMGWHALIAKNQDNLNEVFQIVSTLDLANNNNTSFQNRLAFFKNKLLAIDVEKMENKQSLQQILIITILVIATLFMLGVFLLLRNRKLDSRLIAEQNRVIALKEENEKLIEQSFNRYMAHTESEKKKLKKDLRLKEQSVLELDRKTKLQQEILAEKDVELKTLIQEQILQHERTQEIRSNIQNLRNTSESKGITTKLNQILNYDEGWHTFKLKFEKIYPEFFQMLLSANSELSENDLRISSFIKIGLKNKEIAALQLVTPRAVEKAKARLKKKLNLASDIKLNDYIKNLDQTIEVKR